MTSIGSALATVATIALLVGSSIVPAPQDAKPLSAPPGTQLSRFGDGLTVGDLLATWTQETGRRFVWREGVAIRERRLTLTAAPQYAAADADFVYESMLASVGLALIPAGPAETKMFIVEDIERSSVKSRSKFIPREQLGTLNRFPAQVFVTAFPLQHLGRGPMDYGSPIQQMLANRNVEFVSFTGNSIIIVGFGPTLAAIGELMNAIDVPGAEGPKAPGKEGGEKK